ncbi:MAG: hypothetical protein GF309_02155 [Candidatus Lokiarchaeota archaeon]|nr:hypothetical protein [Candidatus Lokiarchaeota archaeon]
MIEISIKDKKYTVNPSELDFIDAGGQGSVYKWRNYTLKFHENDSILRKMREVNRRISGKKHIPKCLEKRTFMIGTGNAKGSDLGLSLANHLYVLVFRWLEGSGLNYKKLSRSRFEVADYILKGLLFLEDIEIVHADLTPDNYLVDKDGIPHMIDIEGAGIPSRSSGQWDYKPAVLGTKIPGFPWPPEKQKNPRIVNDYTERWFGLALVTAVATGITPFFFLRRCDYESLKEMERLGEDGYEKGKVVKWPPLGIENHTHLHDPFKKQGALEELREKWDDLATGSLVPMLFNTFVRGASEPENRASFRKMRTMLGFV